MGSFGGLGIGFNQGLEHHSILHLSVQWLTSEPKKKKISMESVWAMGCSSSFPCLCSLHQNYLAIKKVWVFAFSKGQGLLISHTARSNTNCHWGSLLRFKNILLTASSSVFQLLKSNGEYCFFHVFHALCFSWPRWAVLLSNSRPHTKASGPVCCEQGEAAPLRPGSSWLPPRAGWASAPPALPVPTPRQSEPTKPNQTFGFFFFFFFFC